MRSPNEFSRVFSLLLLFFKIFQIALIASRLGQFWKILKTLVQLILNSTWPHVITYTNFTSGTGVEQAS